MLSMLQFRLRIYFEFYMFSFKFVKDKLFVKKKKNPFKLILDNLDKFLFLEGGYFYFTRS